MKSVHCLLYFTEKYSFIILINLQKARFCLYQDTCIDDAQKHAKLVPMRDTSQHVNQYRYRYTKELRDKYRR